MGGRAYAILALVALAATAPCLVFGPGAIDSAPYNYVWTTQVAEGLSRGEFYIRWLPRSFEGLGAPTFYFYPPFAFQVSGVFAAVGAGPGYGISLAVLTLTLLSGVSMRAWLDGRSARPLVWACLYMIAPYHLADWYRRAALAEYSAFVWLPLIALAIESWPKRWAAPLLAATYAALIMSHLPVALLASLFLVAPLAAAACMPRRDLHRLAETGLALAVGLALAAVYLVPALTLQPYISDALLWGASYRPSNWAITDASSPVEWPLRSRFVPVVGALVVLAAGAVLVARADRSRKVVFWGALAIVTAVLALGLPPQLWDLPLLSKVQFPYRILAVTEFAALTAAAMAPPLPRPVLAAGLAIALSAYFRTAEQAALSLQHAKAIHQFDAGLPDAVEYLPARFTAGGFDPRARIADLRALRGPPVRGPARVMTQNPNGGLTLRAETSGTVVVRRFYFPAWRVTRDGQTVAARPSGAGRLLSFDATPGVYRVDLAPLPQERWGWAISAAGLVALAGLTAARRRRQA